jgi:hypothetical protein
VFLSRLWGFVADKWPLLQWPLGLLAVAHLGMAALLPAGRNMLFDLRAGNALGYLTFFAVNDTLGYYATTSHDAFLIYKIYAQDGGVVDGAFPDGGVLPRIRYDRWAVAGNAAVGPYPPLHKVVIQYILDRLASPPVRIELYAAHWGWDRNDLSYPWPGPRLSPALDLSPLGTYDGFTRVWKPAPAEENAR